MRCAGDLKPANFVFVKGHLKLIDFGIAKSFNNDTTNIYRESQIGTVRLCALFLHIVACEEIGNHVHVDVLCVVLCSCCNLIVSS